MLTSPDPKQPASGAAPDVSNLDQWVEAVRADDREAYRWIIQTCEAKVRVVLAAILPDPDAVDDLAQEVFVTAYRKLGEYRAGSDFVAWLKAIARNLALNERRRWFRHARGRDRFELEMEQALEPVVLSMADRFAEGPVLQALRECVEQLEEPSHGVIRDFYFQEIATEEIGRRLGRNPGWVRLILFRARTALATCLQSKGVS
jgi:RNA polymerase sigma-70 factor, ECF subfamily